MPPPFLPFQYQHLDRICSHSCKGVLLWPQVIAQPSTAGVHVSDLASPANGFTCVILSPGVSRAYPDPVWLGLCPPAWYMGDGVQLDGVSPPLMPYSSAPPSWKVSLH